jgi:hypothetical protein
MNDRKIIGNYRQIPDDNIPEPLTELRKANAKKIRLDNAMFMNEDRRWIEIVKPDNTVVRGLLRGNALLEARKIANIGIEFSLEINEDEFVPFERQVF